MNTPAPGIDASTALESEENKLLATAKRMRMNNTMDNIRKFILSAASADGLSEENIEAVVNRVMDRLWKESTRKHGQKLGIAHNPNTQFQRIWKVVQTLRGPGF